MSDQLNPRYHVNANPNLRYTWLKGWTTGDIVVAILSAFALPVAFKELNLFLALFFGLVLLLINVPATYGHVWYDLGGLSAQGGYTRFVLGGYLYINPEKDDSPALIRWLRQKRYRRRDKRYVFPIHHTVVEARGTKYGIIQQIGRAYDHLPVRGHNSDYGSFDHVRQDYATTTLARNVDRLSMLAREQYGLKIGVSSVRMTRPLDETKIQTFFYENGQPLIFAHEAYDLDAPRAAVMAGLRDSADQIIPTMQASGVSESWQLMLPTIKRTREMEQAQKNKLSEESLYDLRLIELGRQMVEAIKSSGMNVRNVHCLSYLELCQLIRAGWNVRDLSYLAYKGGDSIRLVTQEDVDEPDSPYGPGDIGTLKDPFPVFPTEYIKVGSDYICMDGNWISSFLVTKQPESYHVSDVQRAYHDESPAGVWSSMASAGDTISGSTETNVMVYRQRLGEDFGNWWNSNPSAEHPKRRRRRAAMQNEAEELSLASLAQRYNDVGTVVAPDRDAMVAWRSAVMAGLQNQGYKCRLIKRTARQLPGFITGAYGINGL